ncbi:MAG: hypothetical protein M3395_02565 [Chloroflexota bacterium]|nr:hypothetical protein [Chloroflexota bacterium]
MKERQGAILFAAILMFAAALFAVPGTVRAAGCDATFVDSRDFRKQLGFATDAELIRSLANDPDTDCSWGVPLTYAEAAEIQRRQANSSRIAGLKSHVEAHSDTFDVLYTDHAAGGIVVNVKAGASVADLGAARALVPMDIAVRFDLVRYSRDEIAAAAELVGGLVFGEESFEGLAGFGSGNKHNAIDFDIRCDRVDELAALLESHVPAAMLRYDPFGDCALPDSSTTDLAANDSPWVGPSLVAFFSLAWLAVRLGPTRTRRTTD